FSTAYLAKREVKSANRRNFAGVYLTIAWIMLATLIVVVVLHWRHPELFSIPWVTILESTLILEFFAYWVVQTIDLWNSPERSDRLSEADQDLLAHRRTTRGLAGLMSELREVMNAQRGHKVLRFL